ncbi:MAG: cell division protein ZapA [Hyphomicrobiales bacterium]
MAQVVVQVSGRPYTMQCADGEEPHLQRLAQMLDTEVGRIRDAVGNVGDIRLLMMAGLVLADRLHDSQREIATLKDQVRQLRQQAPSVQVKTTDDKVAQRLDAAAKRLEQLARDAGKAH